MLIDHYFKAIMATLGAGAGWVFGAVDPLIYALLAFIAADYLSGVMVAVYTRNLSSSVGFKGLFGKMLILSFVALGHLIDAYVLGGTGALRGAVIFFYLANEGISLIENASALGLPIPPKFQQALAILTEHNSDIAADCAFRPRHTTANTADIVLRPHTPATETPVSETRKPLTGHTDNRADETIHRGDTSA